MKTLRIALTAAAALVLAVGVVAAGAQVARVIAPEVSGCKTWQAPAPGGLVKMEVPRFCKNGQCEISVKWDGAYAGAFGPGLSWQVNYTQWDDGYWNAGPNVNIAGVSVSGGFGRNGDSSASNVLGPYTAQDGSYFEISDDLPGFETSKRFFTLVVDNATPSTPTFQTVIAFVCKR